MLMLTLVCFTKITYISITVALLSWWKTSKSKLVWTWSHMPSRQVVHDATARLAQLRKEGCHRYLISTNQSIIQITPDVTLINRTLECSREMATQRHHAQAGHVLIGNTRDVPSVVRTTAPGTVHTVAEWPPADVMWTSRPQGQQVQRVVASINKYDRWCKALHDNSRGQNIFKCWRIFLRGDIVYWRNISSEIKVIMSNSEQFLIWKEKMMIGLIWWCVGRKMVKLIVQLKK